MAKAAKKEVKKEAKAETATVAQDGDSARGRAKRREGLVVSDKMEKTVIVAVTRQVRHAQYGKYVRSTSKYIAHDQKDECGVGDLVRIVETRPLSKTKRWRVEKIMRKASL